MKRFGILLAALLFAAAAHAQGTVVQGGPWTPGHAPAYSGSGGGQPIIQDSGPAGGAALNTGLSELLLTMRGNGAPPYSLGTGQFGTNACDYDAPPSNGGGYHFLCFGPDANGQMMIAAGHVGAVPALPFVFSINGQNYPIPGSVSGMANVANLTALQNTASTFAAAVMRLDYAAGNGAPPVVYTSSPSACALNAGAGDNGAQVRSSDGRCWIAQFGLSADVREWGALCNGSTDDHVALVAALASGALAITGPMGATCYTTVGVAVGANTALFTEGSPLANPPTALKIKCHVATVSVCITGTTGVSGSSAVGAANVRGVSATFDGTPAAGSIDILITSTYDFLLERVSAQNAAIGIEVKAVGIYGITARLLEVETCQITDAHIVDDGWPELRMTQGRIGCNADGVTSNDMMRFQNTGAGPSNTPNTVYVDNSQFNIGNGTAACWLHFVGITSSMNEYSFIGNHLEGVTNGICSDSTTGAINRLNLIGNFFLNNAGGSDFFALNANTTIDDWMFVGNHFAGWSGVTLALTNQINHLVGTGNIFNGPSLNITGAGNSVVDFEGNFYSGITLGGSFLQGVFKGTGVGAFVNNSASAVEFAVNNASPITPFTPSLQFGGASTGITYATQSGGWQLNGRVVTYSFNIVLTNAGSATGPATIAGLPITANLVFAASAMLYVQNMTLGGAVMATPAAGGTLNLYQVGTGGVGQLINSNFTNGAAISGTISYFH